jgi:hypothetical protein
MGGADETEWRILCDQERERREALAFHPEPFSQGFREALKSWWASVQDGVVSLMERIWPSFQGIDTSSGALGAAVLRTVNELIPILGPRDQRQVAREIVRGGAKRRRRIYHLRLDRVLYTFF